MMDWFGSDIVGRVLLGFIALCILTVSGLLGYAVFYQGPHLYSRAMNGDKGAAVEWCDSFGSGGNYEYCLNSLGFEIVEKAE